jgi:hypothetical protein
VKDIVPMHNIVCMWNTDETPLYLDMLVKRTIQTKANVRFYLNTGNERKMVSALLDVSEYGHKLRPILVVKDNT